jgi:poly(A) polymerase
MDHLETAREAATHVARQLMAQGKVAWLAGGCVRDGLMGRTPKDYDIATDARPEEVECIFPGSMTVGAHFGVVVVRRSGHQIEVATFRRDGTYTDGRHPESVTFSSAEEDAQRRDFTINGLFQDPISGEVVDYVGGRADIHRQLLRAIGQPRARFQEDHLRLLRAIRFATVLGFELEPETWQAVCELSPQITTVSAERVRDEFSKIMVHSERVRGFDLLVQSGLMAHILPEILVLQGCEQPPQFHPEGDVYVHTRLMLTKLQPESTLPVVLSVLLHDIAKPATQTVDDTGRIRFNGHDRLGAEMAEVILRRMKYPNHVIDSVVEAVDNHMVFKDVPKMRVSKLKRFMARPNFETEMELHRVDCLGCHGFLDNYDFLRAKQAEFASEPLIPERILTGADLLDLGWPAGPTVGQILTEAQNLQLEGTLTTREQALTWAKDRVASQA